MVGISSVRIACSWDGDRKSAATRAAYAVADTLDPGSSLALRAARSRSSILAAACESAAT